MNIPCEDCGYFGLTYEAADPEVEYYRCPACKGVTCLTTEDAQYTRFCNSLAVPFCQDWVDYKGETYLAHVNYEKSYACRRTVVDLAHCLTYDLPIKTVNWNPEHFAPHPRLSQWLPVARDPPNSLLRIDAPNANGG